MTESRGFRGDSLNETDRANKCHFPDEPIKYHHPPRPSMDDGRRAIKRNIQYLGQLRINQEDRWDTHQSPH